MRTNPQHQPKAIEYVSSTNDGKQTIHPIDSFINYLVGLKLNGYKKVEFNTIHADEWNENNYILKVKPSTP